MSGGVQLQLHAVSAPPETSMNEGVWTCQLTPRVSQTKHSGKHTHPPHTLGEEQWHHGYVWHMHTHNHTARQLWFPQVAALSRQRQDLTEASFNTDVKTSELEGDEAECWQRCSSCAALIDKETNSYFNPPLLSEHPLHDQVVTQFHESSFSHSRASERPGDILLLNLLQLLVVSGWEFITTVIWL